LLEFEASLDNIVRTHLKKKEKKSKKIKAWRHGSSSKATPLKYKSPEFKPQLSPKKKE
jgi:hypothetical protein